MGQMSVIGYVVYLFCLIFFAGVSDAVELKVQRDHPENGPDWVRAEGVLDWGPEYVWDVLYKSNEYRRFMPRVLESLYISEKGIDAIKTAGTKNANRLRDVAKKYEIEPTRKRGGVWEGFFFIVLDTPFPVENRWFVFRVVHDERRAKEYMYKRCWNLVIGNVNHANGCWDLRQAEDPSKSYLIYEDSADIGGKVPRWVLKLGVKETVPEIFKRLEGELKRRSPRVHLGKLEKLP